ncbi:hypothetical protein V6N11_049078 [Hibiscus sabdariffa]|uniref:Uncharacterized protein n=1 Tax=Hibiscus sabdariffa TaxID=183260 RepID=A0ABR2PX44_9ROSI
MQFRHRKCIPPLAFASTFALLLLLFTTYYHFNGVPFLSSRHVPVVDDSFHFVEHRLKPIPVSTLPSPPRFAYLISGSAGNGNMLRRVLLAIYHPLNQYIVHLDRKASPQERLALERFVKGYKVFKEVGNVRMIVKANLITYRGSTMVANTLHAAAILLREGGDWDWGQRAKPVIIDSGLYNLRRADVFWIRQRRSVPTAFKLFTGSAWMVLSRPFIEYCVWGWDNLPRKVLMYYTNFLSSPEGYFHTVICNAEAFRNTTVNSDLHFISWDNPPRQHPQLLRLAHMKRMLESNAPFARKFYQNGRLLDKIDAELLSRGREMFTPGGWCVGSRENGADPCSVVGTPTVLKPGPGAQRLQALINFLLSDAIFRPRQCE